MVSDLNGQQSSIKPKTPLDIKIRRLKNIKALPKFGHIFEEYIEELTSKDDIEKFITSVFTSFNYPDTVFYIAFNEEKEAVGFLWAETLNEDNSIHIKEFYSNLHGAGKAMFEKLKDLGHRGSFSSIRGYVSIEKAEAMKEYLDMDIEGYLLRKDL